MKIRHLIILILVLSFGFAYYALGAQLSQQEINDILLRQRALPPERDSILDSQFFSGIIFPLLMVAIIVFNWLVNALSASTKDKILRFIFVSSPVCLIIFATRVFFVTTEVNPLIDLVVFGAFLVLVAAYLLWGIFPAASAYAMLGIAEEIFSSGQETSVSTFWNALDRIKTRRFWLIVFLVVCLAVVAFADLILLSEVKKNNAMWDNQLTALLIFSALVVFVLYLLRVFHGYGKVDVPEAEHIKADELKKMIDNLSITAGIRSPDLKIIACNNPNAFSICPNFGGPIIYVTTDLLNLADKRELEAVVSHEIASISSGQVFDYRLLDDLLGILKILSFLSLLLVFLAINPMYVFLWLFLVFYAGAGYLKNPEWHMDAKSLFDSIVTLANPPFLVVNFISHLLYYRLSLDEVYYTDMQGVQFTRDPHGLHSILTKLENYRGFTEKLPEEFYYLYFVGEGAAPRDLPMPQPTIAERKALLEKIDNALIGAKPKLRIDRLKCPFCDEKMEEKEGKGFYGAILKINCCSQCKSAWFDNWEFWYMASMDELKGSEILTISRPENEILCPRCGVELERIFNRDIPQDIEIWSCPSCNGNLLNSNSLHRYLEYKKECLKEKVK